MQLSNQSKQMLIFGVVVMILIIGIFFFDGFSFLGGGPPNIPKEKLDAFAQCLTQKGVKMYGAYWCSHCENQKKAFGSSWKYIVYVECSLPNNAGRTPICINEGVDAYPTWEISGKKRVGELSFDELSQYSGCPLNQTA